MFWSAATSWKTHTPPKKKSLVRLIQLFAPLTDLCRKDFVSSLTSEEGKLSFSAAYCGFIWAMQSRAVVAVGEGVIYCVLY